MRDKGQTGLIFRYGEPVLPEYVITHCLAGSLQIARLKPRRAAECAVMTVTGKPPADPDDVELDSTYFPVSAIEHVAKEVIRAALPVDRFAMWQAYTETVRDAAEHSADRMPWDPPEEVTRITARSARRVLTAVLTAIPDEEEQARLAKVGEREAEKAEQAQADGEHDTAHGITGRFPSRHCRQCGASFRPRRPNGLYCRPACRQAFWKLAQRAKAQAG